MSNLGCCTSGSRVGFPLTLMFVSTVELGWRARWTLWGSTTTNATTVLFGSVIRRGAQELLDQQLQTDWSSRLDELLSQAHPLHAELGRPIGQRYYWSASQTEFATDLCFKDAASLQKLYPQFLHHAIRSFNSSDVLRFLGKQFPQMFRSGEVKSTLKNRPEGVRVRHSVKGNSLKLMIRKAAFYGSKRPSCASKNSEFIVLIQKGN